MTHDEDQRSALLARLAGCDLPTLRRLVALAVGDAEEFPDSHSDYLAFLERVADSDVKGLRNSERSYGNSWKRRGGVDTYQMLLRKWERLENRVAAGAGPAGTAAADPYDIFAHVAADCGAEGLIDDIRDLRRYLMLVEAEAAIRGSSGVADSGRGYLDRLPEIAQNDVATIERKEKSHAASWKRGGGTGAFMMLARKWDRISQRVTTRIEPAKGSAGAARDNLFEHIAADHRAEGLIDDIRGLRQYLLLVEAEMAARGAVEIGTARDDRESA